MTENKSPVDEEFLAELVGDDPEFEKELFDIFLKSCDKNLSQMEQAIRSNEDNTWYTSAHSLKGAASSIGAFDLSKLFEYGQKHPEESPEQKQELLKKIRAELALVSNFIKQKNKGV